MKQSLVVSLLLSSAICRDVESESHAGEDKQKADILARFLQDSLGKFWIVVSSLNITVGNF